jgi:hypothetical protein
MKRNNFLMFLLATTMAAHAHAGVSMNDNQVMEASISNKGLTRLSVKGDTIQDIFVYPFMVGNVVTSESIQLHKSGHVFIAPDGIKEPFYLTLITQKGQVQDLKLSPVTQKVAPLVLSLPAPEENMEETEKENRKILEKYVLAALQGIPPRGFKVLTFPDASGRKLGDIHLTPVASYTSSSHRLNVFDLENKGDKDIALMPEFFLSSDDVSVAFEKPTLLTQGKIRMVILSQAQPLSATQSSVDAESLSSTQPQG